jgi:hypothetical protein
MSFLKNRDRLVSFRLTPDELESLRVACLLRGARSISEFARGAVLESSAGRMESQMLDRIAVVEQRLNELQSLAGQHQEELRTLARALARSDEKAQGKGA